MSPETGVFSEPIFLPNFGEALAFAVVVAHDVDSVALSQPTMQLGEKFATLGFGDRRFGRTLGKWTVGIETLEVRSAECRVSRVRGQHRFPG